MPESLFTLGVVTASLKSSPHRLTEVSLIGRSGRIDGARFAGGEALGARREGMFLVTNGHLGVPRQLLVLAVLVN